MIISGTVTPASRTEDSVALAVAIILGRMEALMAAVRVRRVRPYSLVMSDAMETGRPCCSARSWIFISTDISSTPNAIDATMTLDPLPSRLLMAAVMVSSLSCFFLMNSL